MTTAPGQTYRDRAALFDAIDAQIQQNPIGEISGLDANAALKSIYRTAEALFAGLSETEALALIAAWARPAGVAGHISPIPDDSLPRDLAFLQDLLNPRWSAVSLGAAVGSHAVAAVANRLADSALTLPAGVEKLRLAYAWAGETHYFPLDTAELRALPAAAAAAIPTLANALSYPVEGATFYLARTAANGLLYGVSADGRLVLTVHQLFTAADEKARAEAALADHIAHSDGHGPAGISIPNPAGGLPVVFDPTSQTYQTEQLGSAGIASDAVQSRQIQNAAVEPAHLDVADHLADFKRILGIPAESGAGIDRATATALIESFTGQTAPADPFPAAKLIHAPTGWPAQLDILGADIVVPDPGQDATVAIGRDCIIPASWHYLVDTGYAAAQFVHTLNSGGTDSALPLTAQWRNAAGAQIGANATFQLSDAAGATTSQAIAVPAMTRSIYLVNYAAESGDTGRITALHIELVIPQSAGVDSHRLLKPGGTAGQFEAKKSDANYDVEWRDLPTAGIQQAGIIQPAEYIKINSAIQADDLHSTPQLAIEHLQPGDALLLDDASVTTGSELAEILVSELDQRWVGAAVESPLTGAGSPTDKIELPDNLVTLNRQYNPGGWTNSATIRLSVRTPRRDLSGAEGLQYAAVQTHDAPNGTGEGFYAQVPAAEVAQLDKRRLVGDDNADSGETVRQFLAFDGSGVVREGASADGTAYYWFPEDSLQGGNTVDSYHYRIQEDVRAGFPAADIDGLAAVATTGDYEDLINRPPLPDGRVLFNGPLAGLRITSLDAPSAVSVTNLVEQLNIATEPHGVLIAELTPTLSGFAASDIALEVMEQDGETTLDAVARKAIYNGTTALGQPLVHIAVLKGITRAGIITVYLSRNAAGLTHLTAKYAPAAGHSLKDDGNVALNFELYLYGIGVPRGTGGGQWFQFAALPAAEDFVDGDLVLVKAGAGQGAYVKESTTTPATADTGLGSVTINPGPDMISNRSGDRDYTYIARAAWTPEGQTQQLPAGGAVAKLPAAANTLWLGYAHQTEDNGELGIRYASGRTYAGRLTFQAGNHVVGINAAAAASPTLWEFTGLDAATVDAFQTQPWSFDEPDGAGFTVTHSLKKVLAGEDVRRPTRGNLIASMGIDQRTDAPGHRFTSGNRVVLADTAPAGFEVSAPPAAADGWLRVPLLPPEGCDGIWAVLEVNGIETSACRLAWCGSISRWTDNTNTRNEETVRALLIYVGAADWNAGDSAGRRIEVTWGGEGGDATHTAIGISGSQTTVPAGGVVKYYEAI